MRAAIAASILFAVLLLGLALSRGGGSVPAGTFRGERNTPVAPGTDPVVADQLRRVELRIDREGNGVLTDGGIPYEGRMSRVGDELRLEVLAINGVNIDRQPADLPRTLKFRVEGGAVSFGVVRMVRAEGR